MRESQLVFVPIDLSSSSELAVKFRADSFTCSFGSDERFFEADGKGPERYLARLADRMMAMPGSCVHVWLGHTIIGQMEMDRFQPDPRIAYINLYYLAPEYRNRGLGRHLDEYATDYLVGQGFKTGRLSVSPTNMQAVRFYLKHGWRDLGPRPGHPEVHGMEKALAHAV